VFISQPDFRDRLRISIAGHPEARLPSIGKRFRDFAGWLDQADIVVRFEDLVGPGGGGTTDLSVATLRALYATLDSELEERILHRLADRVFSSASGTFRKGLAGQWVGHFDKELLGLFQDSAGDVLNRYGYSLQEPLIDRVSPDV
jgi:hypothetical protein